ncbi:MAG TPA: hypothetical protein VD908_19860, partial [Cytophagales bacterium]|nr:hypothetical protein [Cytophagales bacterium]
MSLKTGKTVLILGANSDVAKEAIKLYVDKGYQVIAASRSTEQIEAFAEKNIPKKENVDIKYFDAVAFDTHKEFYKNLSVKPHIVLYAAGFLKNNEEALLDWKGAYQMMNVHYSGAVSILNLIATDPENNNL